MRKNKVHIQERLTFDGKLCFIAWFYGDRMFCLPFRLRIVDCFNSNWELVKRYRYYLIWHIADISSSFCWFRSKMDWIGLDWMDSQKIDEAQTSTLDEVANRTHSVQCDHNDWSTMLLGTNERHTCVQFIKLYILTRWNGFKRWIRNSL